MKLRLGLFTALCGAFLMTAPFLATAAAQNKPENFLVTCARGDVDDIRNALEQGAKVNQSSQNGTTPLHNLLANEMGHGLVEEFIQRGADADARTDDGYTVLMAAATTYSELVNELMPHIKGDINARDHNGRTALMYAASQTWDEKLIDLLVERGAELNAKDKQGNTALTLALNNNMNPAIAVALVRRHKAQLGAAEGDARAPLLQAVIFGKDQAGIAAAVQQGEDIRARGDNGSTALLWAVVFAENTAVIEGLIKQKANVQTPMKASKRQIERGSGDKGGVPPLVLAARYNPTPGIVTLLVKDGAKIDEPDPDTGATPLMMALMFNSNPAVANEFIALGANVKASDGVSYTPLHHAASSGSNAAMLEALIKAGADVGAVSDGGGSALLPAAFNNPNPEVIALLVKNGADINEKDMMGATALMSAAGNNPNPAVIEEILKQGADVNIQDEEGQTVLERLEPERVAWLKQNGVYQKLEKAAQAQPQSKAKTSQADPFAAYLETVKKLDAGRSADARKAAKAFIVYLQASLKGNLEGIVAHVDSPFQLNGKTVKGAAADKAKANPGGIINEVVAQCVQEHNLDEDVFVQNDVDFMVGDGCLWFRLQDDDAQTPVIFAVNNTPG